MQKLSTIISTRISKMPKSYDFTISSLNISHDYNETSVRSYLAREVNKGALTRIKPGHYKKTELFEQFLFVYGSMKKDFPNHERLKNAQYLGDYHTVSYYTMYADTSKLFPYVVNDEKRYQIQGELYKITDKKDFDTIDVLEGIPDFYIKRQISITNDTGHKVSAWIYFRSPSNPSVLKREYPMSIWKNEATITQKRIFIDKLFASKPEKKSSIKQVSSKQSGKIYLADMKKGSKITCNSFDSISFLKAPYV